MQLYSDAWQIIAAFCDNRSAARLLAVCRAAHRVSDLVRWAPIDATWGRSFPPRGRVVCLKIGQVDHGLKLDYVEELTVGSITKKVPALPRIQSLKVLYRITDMEPIMHLTTLTTFDIGESKVIIPSDMFPHLTRLILDVYIHFERILGYRTVFHPIDLGVWPQLTSLSVDYLPDDITNEMMPNLTRLTVRMEYQKIPFMNVTRLAVLSIPDMMALAHLNITHLKTDVLQPIPKGIWPNLTKIECRRIRDMQYVSECKALTSITEHDFGVNMNMDKFLDQ